MDKVEIEFNKSHDRAALAFTLELINQLDDYVLIRDICRYLQVYVETQEEVQHFNKKCEGYID